MDGASCTGGLFQGPTLLETMLATHSLDELIEIKLRQDRLREECAKTHPEAFAPTVSQWAELPAVSLTQWAVKDGLVKDDGYWHCPACAVDVWEWQLETHMYSRRHRNKRWEALQQQVLEHKQPPQKWGDASWFEWHGRGWFWCRLCHCWVDDKHITSRRHSWRRQRPSWYLTDETAASGASTSAATSVGASFVFRMA